MKILHLINTLAAGGAELHLLTLCRELQRRGFEPHVAYLRERGTSSRSLRPDFAQTRINVTNFGGDNCYGVTAVTAVRRLLREWRPDVLHTHLPRADVVGMLANVRMAVPWVSSVHNVYNRFWRGHRLLPILGRVWRRPDVTIAISGAVRDWLVHPQRVPAAKVRIVRYGIELERFASPQRDLRREWGLNDVPVIGCLSRIEPRKGQDRLIRSLPAILRAAPNVVLVLAGHGDPRYAEHLRRLAVQIGVAPHVRFIAFQDDAVSFLHAIDVFALATHAEGFGQVLVEAMATGRPVVTTGVPPMTEIVVHGETGLLVDPREEQGFAKSILALLTQPTRARLMGGQGRRRAFQEFSVSRMADEMTAVYQQACGSKFQHEVYCESCSAGQQSFAPKST